MKPAREIIIDSICLNCAGKGFVGHHHPTNKRNKKKCIPCDGRGDIPKKIVIEG
jgi:DnaJ-class molecular chaperone